MTEARYSHRDHQDDITQDAELAKLAPPEYLEQWELGKWKEAKAKPNNVACVGHTAMPSITRVELGRWGYV